VEDHGSGMSPEILSQALDPFFTTKEVGKGTGLGLPVAFGIIHAHQGFLTIDTALGKGTRARLYLPRLDEDDADDAKAPASCLATEPDNKPGRRILVVDDEEAVLDVVRRFLGIAGHVVVTATSGQAAMEMLARGESVDLIVLDLMIPREEGLANFRRFRQRLPDIPILLCTGLVHADQARQLLQDGAAELLRKPFRMNDLWQAVTKALK
jgi:two-component system, cell cycle sensor histidine kinase and response regulator CckA